MHRDPDLWGTDAEEFRPERWEHARPMWNFVPFGGGPSISLRVFEIVVEALDFTVA